MISSFDAFTIGLCTAAGGLFLRGIYHSGVLAGWLIRYRRHHLADDHCADCQDAGQCLHNRRCQRPAAPKFDLEAHERHLAEGAPLAFWLDYARVPAKGQIDADKLAQTEEVLRQHGIVTPMMHFRAVMGEPKKRKRPYCGCGEGYVHYEDEHEVEMYRLRKKRMREHIERTRGPAYPKLLPCGCPGDGQITVYGRQWGVNRHVECNRCLCWWEPPSNDSTNRRIAQGETLHTTIRDVSDYPLDTPPPPAHS